MTRAHLLIAAVVLFPACGSTSEVEPAPEVQNGPWSTRVEAGGELVVLRAPLAPDGASGADGLPVEARREADSLICTRFVDGPTIRVITFESDGVRRAYGVYGLAGEKNGIPVDLPLSGDPIAWDQRDHAEALAYVLGLAGLDAAAGQKFVSTRAADLFGEGLRVFFVLNGAPAEPFLASVGDGRARVLLIRVDFGG